MNPTSLVPTLAFLFLGDLHLAPRIWSNLPTVTGDGAVGLRDLFALSAKLGCPDVVLGGDIFDSNPPNSDQVTIFQELAARHVQCGGRIWCYQGNHDKVAAGTPWYATMPNWLLPVTHIGDGTPVEIGGLRCVAYDYATKDDILSTLATLNEEIQQGQQPPQVLMLHQAFKEALGFEHAWNCEAAAVPPQIPLTLIGDIHAPIEFSTPGGRAYYSGSSHPRNIDEIKHAPSALAVRTDLSVERIPLPNARSFVRHFLLPDGPSMDEHFNFACKLAKAFADAVLPPVIWLTCADELGIQGNDLQERLREALPFAVVHLEKLATSKVRATLAPETGRPTELRDPVTLIDEMIDPAQHPVGNQLVRDLLSVRRKEDLRGVISATEQRFITGERGEVLGLVANTSLVP